MRRTSIGVAAGAICLAGLTLYLSVPRSIAGVIEFRTQAILISLRRGRIVPLAAQDRLINSQIRAAKWIDSGEHRIDSVFAIIVRRFSRVQREGGNLPSEESFRPVERRLEAGLARSPISASGWRWLAVAKMTHKDAAGAANALRMSLYTGPHQRFVVISRLRLLMQTWDHFPKDEREAIYRQIRFAWRNAPNGVIALAMDSRSIWPFRLALAARPRDLQAFELDLRRAKAEAARESRRPK